MSLCFRLQYGETSMLILGDAQSGREKQLIEDCGPMLNASLLKVAHHGSKHGTTSAFLETVAPHLALISVGERNVYHHPHHEVIDRLRQRNVPVYRTDASGAILFSSDGRQIEQTLWR
jgi:competence protein ComEC